MGRSEPIITKSPEGWTINSITFAMVIIVHVGTIIGLVAAGASQYGVLTTRLTAVEAQTARQVIANEAVAQAIQNLATALTRTQTQVDERTSRVEAQGAVNRSAIQRNREEIKAATQVKPHRSVLSVIGVK